MLDRAKPGAASKGVCNATFSTGDSQHMITTTKVMCDGENPDFVVMKVCLQPQ